MGPEQGICRKVGGGNPPSAIDAKCQVRDREGHVNDRSFYRCSTGDVDTKVFEDGCTQPARTAHGWLVSSGLLLSVGPGGVFVVEGLVAQKADMGVVDAVNDLPSRTSVSHDARSSRSVCDTDVSTTRRGRRRTTHPTPAVRIASIRVLDHPTFGTRRQPERPRLASRAPIGRSTRAASTLRDASPPGPPRSNSAV